MVITPLVLLLFLLAFLLLFLTFLVFSPVPLLITGLLGLLILALLVGRLFLLLLIRYNLQTKIQIRFHLYGIKQFIQDFIGIFN